MVEAVRLYSTSAASHLLVEASCEIEAAIAHAETCALEEDEWVVTVNDAETGKGCTFKLDLSQNV